MELTLFNVNRDECNRLAHELFSDNSGIYKREGKKFLKMREEANKMRKVVEDRIKIRAAYAYSENIRMDGQQIYIDGANFKCSAFEQIKPETIKGAYVYVLTVGDFGYPEEPIMDQLYADIWGSSFTDAVRMLLKKELEKESRLSDSFGPGLYGMNVIYMEEFASLIDFNSLDIELRASRVMIPLKSCAGIIFSVTDEYKKLAKECQDCLGTHSSCKLCHVRKGAN